MQKRSGRLVTTVWAAFITLAAHIYPQTHEETLSGPDTHEKPLADRGYLFGNWGGVRSALLERGVSFDLQYISDNLANVVGAAASTMLSCSDSEQKWSFDMPNHPLTEALS